MSDTQTVFAVDNMKCGGCVAKAEQAIRAVPGVTDVQVDLAGKSAVVAGSFEPKAVADALARAGYPARVAG
jgi:copper chaperone CopZ